jgi:Family of unknown function (DUF6524)
MKGAAMKKAYAQIFRRILFGIILVMICWNPTSYSLFALTVNEWLYWNSTSQLRNLPLIGLAWVFLIISLYMLYKWYMKQLGVTGILITTIIISAVFGTLYYYGVLDAKNTLLLKWLVPILLGTFLGFGLSWPIIVRLITGATQTNDPDTGSLVDHHTDNSHHN